ncbi:DUF7488 domain-containing protein [Helicobacter mustelae]|uniref:Periplasmic protein n=1 Tax=Helicobacter mustelae (strain ATCC 43772 / CCUG 25715 / CIP 103759 / LMG 18044 / NCTC 12198 / R85-136P) TaxID=679897 RepID=D3UIB8_HELM1|nr:PDZ domain-containing protein [Helicobacter mustelae]CBG40241.1 Putative hypothetical protein [Helicobacter mustelae 12198]SQH71740.1 Putative periplasmic protein [Helicobacter mustelae]STP12869.1 Putative periplasmic protein [Helicobacter mustelae]
MRKLLLLFFASFSFLWSYDFSYCQKHYHEIAQKFDKKNFSTPVFYKGKTYFILYSQTPLKNKKILRHDPFVGLYLIAPQKEVRGFVLRSVDEIAKELQVSIIGPDFLIKTQILQNQRGFLDFAKLKIKAPSPNLVISNICYQIYGITTQEGGFITKPYIERFLSQEKPYYGDIGVRTQGNIVLQIDPFFPNNPFLPDDKILKIQNKIARKSLNVEWVISNLKEGERVRVLVERKIDKKTITKELSVVARARYGGFLLQDSFLESQKIGIDKNLKITKGNDLLKNGLENLQAGDRILWIARVNPLDLKGDVFDNLREVLMRAYLRYGYLEFLVNRNGFQFFTKVYPRGQ